MVSTAADSYTLHQDKGAGERRKGATELCLLNAHNDLLPEEASGKATASREGSRASGNLMVKEEPCDPKRNLLGWGHIHSRQSKTLHPGTGPSAQSTWSDHFPGSPSGLCSWRAGFLWVRWGWCPCKMPGEGEHFSRSL